MSGKAKRKFRFKPLYQEAITKLSNPKVFCLRKAQSKANKTAIVKWGV
jgi:hypothetical protein